MTCHSRRAPRRSAIRVALVALLAASQAAADAIPLPSCQDPADESTTVLYDVHQHRYVSALRTPAAGERTTLLLDCSAGVGYEILDDGSNPYVVAPDGSLVLPAFATEIIDDAFDSEQTYSFDEVARLAAVGGYEVLPLSHLPACACGQDMLHALDF